MEENRPPSLFYGSAESRADAHEPPPDPMTEPCHRFYDSDACLIRFLGFHVQLDLFVKTIEKYPDDVMVDIKNEEMKRHLGWGYLSLIDTPPETRRQHYLVLMQMLFCSTVNNYLTYIAELLSLVFRSRPEALKSSQVVEIKDILEFSNMTDLVNEIAERRVSQLAYKGMKQLNDELSKTLGMAIFNNPEELDRAITIIEIRNLIVHNRSTVNRVFLSRVARSEMKEGELISIDLKTLRAATRLLTYSVSEIDVRAAEKFALARPVTRESCSL